MSASLSSRIQSTGIYLPEKILSNADLESLVHTTDDWIVTRTGIRERRVSSEHETTVEMGARAARMAIDQAGLAPDQIDMIIASTISPDYIFPSTACAIQGKLGGGRCACFDVQAACTGFIYSMVIAEQFIRSGTIRNALLVGSERVTSVVDWTDRSTCVLFGDGAGAVVVSASNNGGRIIGYDIGANGQYGQMLQMRHFNSQNIFGKESANQPTHIQMSGKEVFKQAVTEMERSAKALMEREGLTMDDIRCVITHQANSRIIEALAQRLKLPEEKCYMNLDRYGNISTACIPVAIHEAKTKYNFKPGDIILMIAFGGGLTWGSILLEW